jgi:hypothetical protein
LFQSSHDYSAAEVLVCVVPEILSTTSVSTNTSTQLFSFCQEDSSRVVSGSKDADLYAIGQIELQRMLALWTGTCALCGRSEPPPPLDSS